MSHLRIGSLIAGCAIAAGSCEAFTGPQAVSASISRVEFSVAAPMLRDSGAVVVTAYPEDAEFELSRHERVRLTVTSSSGDRESVFLWHEGGARGTYFEGSFSTIGVFYTARNDVDFVALEAKLLARGLSYWRPGDFTPSYQVITFDPMRVSQLATELLGWPETRFVDLDQGFVYTDGGNALAGAVRLTFASPRRFDGSLQAAPGDTLRVFHVGPAGDSTAATLVIPAATP